MVKVSLTSCLGKIGICVTVSLHYRPGTVVTGFSCLVALGLLGYLIFSHNFRSELGVATYLDVEATSSNLQYAILIDAGSSGSRVYIYAWPPHTGNPRELLNIQPLRNNIGQPMVNKIEPGLSSCANNPWQASEYIAPLLRYAADNVPTERHKDTPLYIMATAGMRLLEPSQQTAILENLRSEIPKNFSFSFTANNVEIISGKQEGVYQWIAINFVLGRFGHEQDGDLIAVDVPVEYASTTPLVFRKNTVGILDMGGASMQVAFEVTSKVQLDEIKGESHNNLAEFNLGCMEHGADHLYRLYVTTYLSLGANEMREEYEEHVIKLASKNVTHLSGGSSSLFPIRDPCLPLDLQLAFNVTLPFDPLSNVTSPIARTIYLKGSGDFDSCHNNVLPLLKNKTSCPGRGCILNMLPISFVDTDWYAFSEFWYTMEDVLRIGGLYNYQTFRKAVKEFCSTRWSTLEDRFQRKLYPLADKARFRSQCFKSAWIVAVLHDGMGLAKDYSRLHSSPNSIGNKVVHWTLGAVLYRTRFFPLGAVQRENLQQVSRSGSSWGLFHLNPNYVLLICFGLVFAAIFLYLRRLHRMQPNVRRMAAQNSFEIKDLEAGLIKYSYYNYR